MSGDTAEERFLRLWIGATAGLVLVAMSVRFFLNFSHRFPPGVNAAYYPLQSRSWLTHGRLMYDDLPMIFWLNAAVSKALVALGQPLDVAVLQASRILDSVLQPLAAAAIMALGYVWSNGRRAALAGCLGAGTLAVLSPPVMRMLSDFEKNSLGLALMATAVWACRAAMATGRPAAWIRLIAILGLAAMTHVGAFAVTMVILSGVMLVWSWPSSRKTQWMIGAGLCAASAVVLTTLLASFDAHRARRLLGAPLDLFRLGGIESLPIPIIVIALLFFALVVRLLWRDRKSLAGADIAIIASALATTMLLLAPKSSVYFDRFLLMAPIPTSLLLAFVVARLQRTQLAAGSALLAVAIVAAINGPEAVHRPLMNQDVADELRAIGASIANPRQTLVVAPHGFEWWAGYFLDTPVRSEIPDGASHQYARVLMLRNTAGCPPEIVSPFGVVPLDASAEKIYSGRCLEVYQQN